MIPFMILYDSMPNADTSSCVCHLIEQVYAMEIRLRYLCYGYECGGTYIFMN